MKILIYGAGVIGSLYGALLDKAGFDVSIYARNQRLEALRLVGLLYYWHGKVNKASGIKVIAELKKTDCYDFIFLAVRENQLYKALSELKTVKGDIVTLVNSIGDYCQWEEICGAGRIVPAFPGAGGSIHEDILDASLTPAIVQPTTFGEISGRKTTRTKKLKHILRKAKIPFQEVKDMHLWQICHLAMVVPIADAYYEAKVPETAGNDRYLMRRTAMQLKRNFADVRRKNGALSPAKMNLIRLCPIPVMTGILSGVFNSAFGKKFMYEHSMKAPEEMLELHRQFYEYICN